KQYLSTSMILLSIINLNYVLLFYFFFFSSRRRHTRSYGDWSSDVCSSDLFRNSQARTAALRSAGVLACELRNRLGALIILRCARSEERRVGKEDSVLVMRWAG